MGYIKVDGHKDLYRDENTGAIINFDSTSYEQYIQLRRNKKRIKQEQKKEIENLKNEINEIKTLLLEFINESRRN
jgi:hypothetical protein